MQPASSDGAAETAVFDNDTLQIHENQEKFAERIETLMARTSGWCSPWLSGNLVIITPSEGDQLANLDLSRTSAIQTSRLRCLNILSDLYNKRPRAAASQVYPSSPNFFAWLFDAEAYKAWCQRPNDILLLHSLPEIEMAAALSAIQYRLSKTPPRSNTINFHFRSHDDRLCSVHNMLASLSHQLLTLKPSLFVRVQTLCDELVQTVPWRTDQLWALFRGLISSPDLGDIVCFIHMADRCVDVPKEIVEDALAVISSHQSEGSLRLAMTSSNGTPNFSHGYGLDEDQWKSRLITLDLGARGQAGEDKDSTIRKEIHQLIRARPELARFHDQLVERLNPLRRSLDAFAALRLLQARRSNSSYADLDAEISAIPVSLSLPPLFEY